MAALPAAVCVTAVATAAIIVAIMAIMTIAPVFLMLAEEKVEWTGLNGADRSDQEAGQGNQWDVFHNRGETSTCLLLFKQTLEAKMEIGDWRLGPD